jgi:hypothetical protein
VPVPEDIQVHVLDMEINGGCNYKCQMCPQSIGREKEFLKKLSMDTFEKVVDDAMDYGLQTVTLHGSGEPTLNRNFPDYVRAVKERGLKCVSFTNAKKLTPKLSGELIDAGIDILRLSCIGYDKPTYEEWMAGGDYDLVRNNARVFCEMSKGTPSEMHINHLIIDPEEVEYECRMYRKNWGEHTGAFSEIWLMHNWADSDKVNINYHRKGEKRSCGRPFAPLLQVRAGGLGGRSAAVVACCMVLGQDSRGVVGHLDTNSIAEVVQSEDYERLRSAHRENRFDDIEVCRNCDQLYEVPEALVWSDIPGRKYEQSKNLKTLNFGDYHEG